MRHDKAKKELKEAQKQTNKKARDLLAYIRSTLPPPPGASIEVVLPAPPKFSV